MGYSIGKENKVFDWREKCSQKQMKVKKYGPSKSKTKTTNFSQIPNVNLHEDKELKQNDKNKLGKDEKTNYSETKAYSDFVSDKYEDIEKSHISPVGVNALSKRKRNNVKGSNLDKISDAFDDTIISLSNQI